MVMIACASVWESVAFITFEAALPMYSFVPVKEDGGVVVITGGRNPNTLYQSCWKSAKARRISSRDSYPLSLGSRIMSVEWGLKERDRNVGANSRRMKIESECNMVNSNVERFWMSDRRRRRVRLSVKFL